jgi:hypothetical protein
MSVLNNLKTFSPIVSYIKIYCINNFKKLPQIFGGSDEEHFYLVTSLTKVDNNNKYPSINSGSNETELITVALKLIS